MPMIVEVNKYKWSFFKVVLHPLLCSFMRSPVTNMNREAIPCAVDIAEYLMVNEQVVRRAVLRFLSLSVGGNL